MNAIIIKNENKNYCMISILECETIIDIVYVHIPILERGKSFGKSENPMLQYWIDWSIEWKKILINLRIIELIRIRT